MLIPLEFGIELDIAWATEKLRHLRKSGNASSKGINGSDDKKYIVHFMTVDEMTGYKM